MKLRARMAGEDGWVLAITMGLLAMMLTFSLGAWGMVRKQQQQDRKQREAESALNLVEGVLNAQGFALAQTWPGVASKALGKTYTSTTCAVATPAAACPTASGLSGGANFTNVDLKVGATWHTRIRDNGGALAAAYDPARADDPQPTCPVPATQLDGAYCAYDANGDRALWVQAKATVRGRPRNVVALLKLEQLAESTPRTAVTAGGISITDASSSKVILNGTGSQIVVRCPASSGSTTIDDKCINAKGGPGQLTPYPSGSTPTAPNMMTPQQLERFKARAQTDGRYFKTCQEAGNDINGPVVWIESCDGSKVVSPPATVAPACNPAPVDTSTKGTGLNAASCVNQLTKPGMLIIHCGSMGFGGNWTFVGVIYAVNNSDGTCATAGQVGGGSDLSKGCDGNANASNNVLVFGPGGFGVWGAAAVDGPGCLYAGANGIQVQFDPNVFNSAASYGTVGLVQNTWRELKSVAP